MIKDEIQKAIIEAMRAKNENVKDILRVALGDMQTIESREGSITEEKCQKILKKMIYNNEQNLDAYSDNMSEDQQNKAKKENEILEKFVTKTLSKDEIKKCLVYSPDTSVVEEDHVGKAIGLAMKYFKNSGRPVDGKVVAEVVREMKENRNE